MLTSCNNALFHCRLLLIVPTDEDSLHTSPSKDDGAKGAENSIEDSIKSYVSHIQLYDNTADFEKNLPQTVTILTHPSGSKVYLVGTAHFSKQSQDDVSFVRSKLNSRVERRLIDFMYRSFGTRNLTS